MASVGNTEISGRGDQEREPGVAARPQTGSKQFSDVNVILHQVLECQL